MIGIAALLAVGVLSACSSAPIDSGITGTATIGPTQPVAQPGVPDAKPYSANLVISPKAGLHLKRPVTVKSAEDGSFRVNLEPGDYVITAAGAQTPPTLAPVEVVVAPHEFVRVELQFDSGIR